MQGVRGYESISTNACAEVTARQNFTCKRSQDMSRLQPACSLPAASLQPSCSLSQASLQPPDSLLEGACYPVLSQTIGREQRDTVAGRRGGGVVRGDGGGFSNSLPSLHAACAQPLEMRYFGVAVSWSCSQHTACY